jgi:hypothetical protein
MLAPRGDQVLALQYPRATVGKLAHGHDVVDRLDVIVRTGNLQPYLGPSLSANTAQASTITATISRLPTMTIQSRMVRSSIAFALSSFPEPSP